MSNPYSAPTHDMGPSEQAFADELAEMVREYRIWHTGLGGLGLLLVLLILLGAAGMLFAGLAAGGGEAAMMMTISVVYLVMAAIYGIPAVLLLRSGLAAMRVFSGSEDREPILESIRMQLYLWRVMGVLTFGIAAMYAVLFGLMLLGGLAFGL
ncbi:MAG: hypothetical protein R3F61_31060 [Myxococcota bacterium]